MRSPTTTEQRLDRLEAAIASLAGAVAMFKPVMNTPANRGLHEIVAEVSARNGGQEARPFVMPEATQVAGRVS